MRYSIVGYGAVGRALSRGLQAAGWEAVGVGCTVRGSAVAASLVDDVRTFKLENLPLDVDLLILAVPDAVLEETAKVIAKRDTGPVDPFHKRVVMHLSGRLGLTPLESFLENRWSRLAWHPLQTFVRGVGPDRFNGITIGVTADKDAEKMAWNLASQFNARIWLLKEKDRIRYHRAAVVASNFLPLLVAAAATDLDGIAENEVDAISGLLPLMRGMMQNLEMRPPLDAMTGPVARDDIEALVEHMKVESDTWNREVYLRCTQLLVKFSENMGLMNRERSELWHSILLGYFPKGVIQDGSKP